MNPSLRNPFEKTVPERGSPASVADLLTPRPLPLKLEQLKSRIHREMLSLMDLRRIDSLPEDRLRSEIRALAERLLQESNLALNEGERRQVVQGIQDEMLGLGPIEPLMADPSVSDILVNGPHQVYVERHGRICPTTIQFDNEQHLMRVIERIVSRIGRRVDETSPMVDARLADGSRVNAIIPPLSLDGPLVSIRRFAVVPYALHDLVQGQTLTQEMADLLSGLVKAKVNLLISGGTGSGKTTLLNVISASIAPDERIITIEDAAELQLQQPHVVRMESRPENIEGKGEVTLRALLRNSLRMRPDRIIMGEVRGPEVLDMLQAMNSGHEGSMSTIHANSPRDAITRLEHMLGMAGLRYDARTLRQQIAAAVSVIVQVARLPDGQRKLVSLQEITGLEGEVVSMQEIYRFEQTGVGRDGRVLGDFCCTGIRPKFMQRLQSRGIGLAEDAFEPRLMRSR